MSSDPRIFVWDCVSEGECDLAIWVESEERTVGDPCQYCGEALVHVSAGGIHGPSTENTCGFCGWWDSWWESPEDTVTAEAVLKSFALNDTEIPIATVGAYLNRHADRLQDLHWRRFEEVLAAAFREHGWEVELGRGTRDGGIDLVLFRTAESTPVLVQAKRTTAKVGVDLVRELRGVQLREAAPHAILVTTSEFTAGAKAEAAARTPAALGYSLDLMAAHDVVAALDVFRDRCLTLVDVDRLRPEYRARHGRGA